MKQILETERIYLRQLTQEDHAALCSLLQDAEVMYAYEHAFSAEEVQEWLDRQLTRYQEDGIGLWAIISKETGEFLGQCGLTWQETDQGRELEVGYLLKKAYWHKGYATEAAKACKDYAFYVLGKNRVTAIIRDNNLPSQRVAKRLGMVPERQFVKHYYGMDMPHIVYSITCQEDCL